MTYTFRAVNRTNRWVIAGLIVWGAALALWLARPYFLLPADQSHENHETNTYAGRLIEFRDLLAHGHLSPQWCGDFRGGLGAPYFGYYQPGFFYAASLVPWHVPPIRALGITVAAFALLGYLGMLGLVGRRFGWLSGWLAGTALCTSIYVCSEVAIRGDLSELAAMMTLPATLWALVEWLEGGRARWAVGLAAGAAALVLLHPVVALLGYGLLAVATAGYAAAQRRIARPLTALASLAAGAGLAAFYWMPVLLEMDLVQAERAFTGFYHYANHFVDPRKLVEPYSRRDGPVPLSLGLLWLGLAVANTAALALRWNEATTPQRRLLLLTVLASVPCVFLMTPASAPIWAILVPLQRIQFPWRILSVLSVLLAVAAGAMLPWTHERLRRMVVGAMVVAMTLSSCAFTAYTLDDEARVPDNAAAIARQYFAPDLRNEWLPRGAEATIDAADRQAPLAGPGCTVEDFQRGQGRLTCRVHARRDTWVVLPHYAFPAGWTARLGGEPIPIAADRRGLMRFELPAGTDALLEVTASYTPARRWGWIVAAATLLAGVGLGVPLSLRRGAAA